MPISQELLKKLPLETYHWYKKLVPQIRRLNELNKEETERVPTEEIELKEITLENGIQVLIDFSLESTEPLTIQITYPIGSQQEPAAHLIEHMMSEPEGVGYLGELLKSRNILINGSTGYDTTKFHITIPHDILNSVAPEEYDQFLTVITGLLFGMTIFPDFTPEAVQREQQRMSAEFASRADRVGSRLYDYILPILLLNEEFCSTSPEKELSFTAEEIQMIHAQRPHADMSIEIWGNPQSVHEHAQNTLTDALNQTFGKIYRESATGKKRERPNIFSRGRNIRLFPDKESKATYFGITSVLPTNPSQRFISVTAEEVLGKLIREECFKDGLIYGSNQSVINFNEIESKINFWSVLTNQVDKVFGIHQTILEKVLAGNFPEYDQMVKTVQLQLINSFVNGTIMSRGLYSQKLGLPLDNNCEALYNLYKNLDPKALIEECRRLISDGNIGMLHYGPPSEAQTLPGFTEIKEADLIEIWKQSQR